MLEKFGPPQHSTGAGVSFVSILRNYKCQSTKLSCFIESSLFKNI